MTRAIINLTQHAASAEQIDQGVVQLSFDAMIGGAPYLLGPLAKMLIDDFKAVPLYAFTQRVSVEDPTTGVKTSVFKHMGFVPHI